MAKLVSHLLSVRNQRIFGWAMAAVIFIVLIALAVSFAGYLMQMEMRRQSNSALLQSAKRESSVASTIQSLERIVSAPCSPVFRRQLQRIAYQPDGISQILYAPGGVVQCTPNLDLREKPFDLGKPDMSDNLHGGVSAAWFDRDLGFIDLPALTGTVWMVNSFAVVLAPSTWDVVPPAWMDAEFVLIGADGSTARRLGTEGVYAKRQSMGWIDLSGPDPILRSVSCRFASACVATQGSIGRYLLGYWQAALIVVMVAALLAGLLANMAKVKLRRYWSFEARFLRHLNADSIVCVYQPIMEVKTGRIAGCEVLARWRDVDGTIVYPDRFLSLVEKNGLTRQMTQFVVDRAFAELSAGLPQDRPLFVTFNIFPRDFIAAKLGPIFARFLAQGQRFQLTAELVESDAVVVPVVQQEIEALRALGIRTYIDDFGSGYSSIENLAALSVDGVKLDRSFAMAPDDGMMGQMLAHAIKMVHIAGRAIVVEGVETAERLKSLQQIDPPIDYVQGYHISRPLGIDQFVPFLEAHERKSAAYLARRADVPATPRRRQSRALAAA